MVRALGALRTWTSAGQTRSDAGGGAAAASGVHRALRGALALRRVTWPPAQARAGALLGARGGQRLPLCGAVWSVLCTGSRVFFSVPEHPTLRKVSLFCFVVVCITEKENFPRLNVVINGSVFSGDLEVWCTRLSICNFTHF